MPSPCSTSFPPARIQSTLPALQHDVTKPEESTQTPKITQGRDTLCVHVPPWTQSIPEDSGPPRGARTIEENGPAARSAARDYRRSDLCMLCRHMRINPVSDRHSASFHAHRGKLMLAPGAASTAAGRVVAILSAAPVATLVNEGIGYDASGNVLPIAMRVTGAWCWRESLAMPRCDIRHHHCLSQRCGNWAACALASPVNS